jgi:DNA gyrase subunit B
VRRLARRYDDLLLQNLLYVPRVRSADFERVDWLTDWVGNLEARLNALDDGARSYRLGIKPGAEGQPVRVQVVKLEHGTPSTRYLTREFFDSAEYLRIAELGDTLAGLIEPGARITRGNDSRDVGSFKEAIDWLLDQARKGQSIQRYKGLGEMNPEQLWDTTINPDSRRLLQVRIEDAVAADEIFTTLMGDAVEPRREFIEKNALAASNIDV